MLGIKFSDAYKKSKINFAVSIIVFIFGVTKQENIMKNLEKKLRDGETIELENTDQIDSAFIWFNNHSRSFCIMLNAKCIHSSKTFNSFEKKLRNIICTKNLVLMDI